MKLPLFVATGLFVTGFFASTPLLAASHMSAGPGHENEHNRYTNPFWRSSYSAYAAIYNSDFSYTPTPEQQAAAEQQVDNYLAAVKKGRKRAASHRYISVETLRPTKKQLDDYTQKQLPLRTAEPSQLRCLMVFDTQTQHFVGSGCYLVTSEPSIGEVTRFETVSAEFVGQGTL
jgi:hypothetical protein